MFQYTLLLLLLLYVFTSYFLNEFVSLIFPILFDVNKGGEEYAYVLFCFKEIAGTHSKIQRIMDLGGAYNLGGALNLLNMFAIQNNIKHFKKSFSRLGCHHQKGGECNCKLLKSYLKHVF